MNEIDLIKIDLQQNDKLYKGFAMIKGNTFPLPDTNDKLLVNKLYLKYNENFQLKVYIEGTIIKEKLPVQVVKETFSFEYLDIFNTLSDISNIALPKAKSSIFIIININDDNIQIKSISDLKIYNLQLKPNQLKNIQVNNF